MGFLDVKTDFAFRKVFGSAGSKPILISFLNALLDLPGGQSIRDLTIVDPYQIPLMQGMKDTYVDVQAVLSGGQQVLIEMQVLNVEGFEKRVLYNAAKAYSTQLKKGENYTLLNPVIALTLTDFVLFPDSDRMISYFKLIEKHRFIEYCDDVELVFIELPKFTKTLEQLSSITDQWLYFVRNAGSLEYIPESLQQVSPIHQAFDIANYAGLTKTELEEQEKREYFIYIQKNAVPFAAKKAYEKGFKKGREEALTQLGKEERAEGIREGQIKLLISMLESRFGSLSSKDRNPLHEWTESQVLAAMQCLSSAQSLTEVFAAGEAAIPPAKPTP